MSQNDSTNDSNKSTYMQRYINYIRRFILLIYNILLYWFVHDEDTASGFFKLLDYFGGFVSASMFAAVFYKHLWRIDLFSPLDRKQEVGYEVGILTLIAIFSLVFFFSRHSAKRELYLSKSLFPPGKEPKNWGDVREKVKTVISVALFFLFYLALS